MSHSAAFSARRRGLFGRVREWFAHDAPVSKACIALWVCVGGFIWYDMVDADFDIFFWTCIFSAVHYVTIKGLGINKIITKKGIGKHFIENAQPLRTWHTIALIAFSISMATAWGYSALISGDWPDIAKPLPSSYVGGIYIHHWMWSFTLVALIRYVLMHGVSAPKRWSRICFAAAWFFLSLVGISFLTYGLFPQQSASWIVFSIIAVAMFSIGYALRRDEVTSPWLFVFLCIQLGVVVGIFGDGALGIARSYASLIIFR